MKFSGHTYDNDVFNSLLDGISKDVELKKTAETKQQAPIGGMDIFSSTTQETLNNVLEDELQEMASELQFAADRAKVAVTRDDLAKFAKIVQKDNLRGKQMERACSWPAV